MENLINKIQKVRAKIQEIQRRIDSRSIDNNDKELEKIEELEELKTKLEESLFNIAKTENVTDDKLLELVAFVENDTTVIKLIGLISDPNQKREAYFNKLNKYISEYNSIKEDGTDSQKKRKHGIDIKDYIEMLAGLKIDDEEKKRYIKTIIDNYNYKTFFYKLFESDNSFNLTDLPDSLQYTLSSIIISLKQDSNKMSYLHILNNIEAKIGILKSMKNKELLMDYLDKNPEIRRSLIRSIYIYNRSNITKMWYFIKLIEAENEIIPHLLSYTRYNLKKLPQVILKDVENYFNGTIPNVNQLSEYGKIGIDEDTLTGKVICNEEQLHLDDLQKSFFRAISSKFQDTKKKISIRDFGGTVRYNGDQANEIETWEDLLKKSKRSKENLQTHSDDILFNPDDNTERIGLIGINGKFYVFRNGNHRLTMLKARYFTELKRANNDPKRIERIEEEYAIYVSEAVELPTNSIEMIGINVLSDLFNVQKNELLIGELIEKGKKTGYQIFNQEGKSIKELKTIEDIKKYIESQIQLIQQNDELSTKWQQITERYLANPKYEEIFKSITQREIEKQETITSDTTPQDITKSELLGYMERCAKNPETINGNDRSLFTRIKKSMMKYIKSIVKLMQKNKQTVER